MPVVPVVPAGGSVEIDDVVIGTTSCLGDGPPGTAPGRYEVFVDVMELAGDGGAGPEPSLVVRAPIEVLPPVVD